MLYALTFYGLIFCARMFLDATPARGTTQTSPPHPETQEIALKYSKGGRVLKLNTLHDSIG